VDDCSSGGLVAYSESHPDTGTPGADPNQKELKKKRVLVLGTGWAATSFLKDLDASLYDIQVVSPRNYFAFTPLLPSVTCGTVEARSIVEPIRNIVKKVSEIRADKFIYRIELIHITFRHTHTYMYMHIYVSSCVCVVLEVMRWKLMEMVFFYFLFFYFFSNKETTLQSHASFKTKLEQMQKHCRTHFCRKLIQFLFYSL
jgi:hypothetical protein